MNQKAYVVYAKRTAVGRMGGTLKNIEPDDLLMPLLEDFKSENLIPNEELTELVIGQAKQTQDHSNIARKVLLKTGLPETLPGYTVHRACGSGMQSIHNALMGIRSGLGQAYLVGGVESMSTAPYYVNGARFGLMSGSTEFKDPNRSSQPGSQPLEMYGNLNMGETAENLAEQYNISRSEQDEFARSSQEKAKKAIESSRFKEEIVPVKVPQRKKEPLLFDTDEHPRDTSLEKLGKLPPAFRKNGTVTAGNSSGLNDGASLMLVVSEEMVKKYNLNVMAEVVSIGLSGVNPKIMGIGPVDASKKALESIDLSIDSMDLVELNEAFAAQSLAVINDLNIDPDKLNVNGGAIALGHPIGNSGTRISVTLVHEMMKRNSKYGLATLCIAGGQGIATVFKSFDG
ncbi:thiolase family protein [Aquisalibacillus elongatus]|uniref:acetyl-CoA C-acetyltransferase n=1 Tax=Aquisalibacillus elongatus TaxID=485577 RepID=A0A3N5C461_9BACI|nr:thiolase family protein [Aquisalibacillus elongatus]RPF54252.1 acetyl-CoA C-acetyltransferase [Aquisalibacillus elongatus]